VAISQALSSGITPGVCTSATRPASPFQGQVIFETDTNRLLVWNGSVWVIPNSTTQNPTGLELITTVTCSSGGTASSGVVTVGSSVSSVVIGNAFSTTYDNYYISYNGAMASASALGLQLGPSTVTGYNSGYYAGISRVSATAVSVNLGTNNASNWNYCGVGDTTGVDVSMWLFQPNKTVKTRMAVQWTDVRADQGWGSGAGYHNSTSSFTGFSMFGAANLTGGTIRVYGYRN